MRAGVWGVLAGLVLAGCAVAPARFVPQARQAPADTSTARVPHPYSPQIRAHFTQLENDRVASRLMRTEAAPADAPFSATRLATDYLAIALREEHASPGGAPSVLRRWTAPVVYDVRFGESVPAAQRQGDLANIGAVVGRMAGATGHPMRVLPVGQPGGNFHVLILSEGERQNAAPLLRQLVPGIGNAAIDLITGLGTETLCLAMAFSRGGGATYTEAVAVIRAEHPDLTRLSCIHEELAQGLGLASDSPSARPSVFNDDQEFATLTQHDLLLLRLHYDPRLRPGMTEAEARPIVFSIASTLVPGET
ncbi:MAG: DUF2927 domain-containing protein [Paracoccaceae bacterium]